MAVRNLASLTGLATVLRRSLLPRNEPAQSNDWHFTVLANGRLTSDVTRSVVQPTASPQARVTVAKRAITCLVMTRNLERYRNAVRYGFHRLSVNAQGIAWVYISHAFPFHWRPGSGNCVFEHRRELVFLPAGGPGS